MEKYQGIVRITDVGGTVFERTLTGDEMVGFLIEEKVLERDVDAALASEEGVERPSGKRAYKKREKPAVPMKLHYERGEKKPCCGSKGRHFKWCKEIGGTGVVGEKTATQKHDHGRLLTEEEYDTVRELREQGKNTMQMRNELGDDCSFQQINWAILIGTYAGYAAHARNAK